MSPTTRTVRCSTGCLAALSTLLFAAAAEGQVLLTEPFDSTGAAGTAQGPAELESRGWEFAVATLHDAEGSWHQGPGPFPFNDPAHEGIGYLAAVSRAIDPAGPEAVAMWAILPELALEGGEEISLWVFSDIAELLEIRFAPEGAGSSPGASTDDVGDFTTLLNAESYPADAWHRLWATVPGPGRLALRYLEVDPGFSFVIGFDDLQVTAGPSNPPLPGAGQTAHWTAAMSPIVIDQLWTIIPTATLVVEAGVNIRFEGDGRLHVKGAARFEGTAEQPITTEATGTAAELSPLIVGFFDFDADGMLQPATLEARHASFAHRVQLFSGAALAATDCAFDFDPPGWNDRLVDAQQATVALERCTLAGGVVDLRECYLKADATTFDNAPLVLDRRDLATPAHLDGCVFRNAADDAAIIVRSGNDVFLGAANVFEQNLYPVRLNGGGLARGSVVPVTGNVNDIVVGHAGGEATSTLAAIDAPYHLDGASGHITVEPGATLHMLPGGRINPEGGRWLGTPDTPITIVPVDAAAGWDHIAIAHVLGPKLESVHIRGAARGAQSVDGLLHVFDCEFEDCGIGGVGGDVFGVLYVERCRFLDNDVALHTSLGYPATPGFGAGVIRAPSPGNPNWLEGNGIGAEMLAPTVFRLPDAWWGHPSGPQHPDNPAGQGDAADPGVDVLPFRSEPPDWDDHPPVVRFEPINRFLKDGEKIILHWTVDDEGPIVAQRLEYSPHSYNPPLETIVPDIDPSARSIELVIPDYVPSSNPDASTWRIVATDERGQEGWSDLRFDHAYQGESLTLDPDVTATGVTVGQQGPITFDPAQAGEVFVMIDHLAEPKEYLSLGAIVQGRLGILSNDIPAISTDLARYAIYRQISNNEKRYWMSDYFPIRPHESAGDQPPQIDLTSPTAGASYRGGAVVPVEWTASDDEGLRGFDIQASYDGGFTWHSVVRDLPAAARNYAWQLPSSTGIADVRVRVIARDARFQTSSDGSHDSFAIAPGESCGAVCGDATGDGTIDVDDLVMVLMSFGPCPEPPAECMADVDGSGVVDVDDLLIVLLNWT